MADISTELTSIANDEYGEQVRTSIRNALNKINTLSGGGQVASIASELNTISTAVYGRDMRSAIHDALYKLNQAVEDGDEGGGGSSVDTLVINVSDGSKPKAISLSKEGRDLDLYIVNADKDTTIVPVFAYSGRSDPLTGSFNSTTFTFQANSANNTIPNLSIPYGYDAKIRFNMLASDDYGYLTITFNVSGGESDQDIHEYLASITSDAERNTKSFSDNAKTELTVVNSMSGRTISGLRLINPNSIAITGSYSGSNFTIPANSNYLLTVSIGYGGYDTITIDDNNSGSDLYVRFNAVISGSGPDLQKHVSVVNIISNDPKVSYSYSDGRDTELLLVNSMKGTTLKSVRLGNNSNIAIEGTYSGTDFTIPANSYHSLTSLAIGYGSYVDIIIKANTIASTLPISIYLNMEGYDSQEKLYDLDLVGIFNPSRSEAIHSDISSDYTSVAAYRLNVIDEPVRLIISFNPYTSDRIVGIACDVEEYIAASDVAVIGKSGNPYDSTLPTTYGIILDEGLHNIYILQTSSEGEYIGLDMSISRVQS